MNIDLKRNNLIHGDCLDIMPQLQTESVDFILTDPPYLVNYRDRSGRSIHGDRNGDWLNPSFRELFRVLKNDSFAISFYGWNRIDQFFNAWNSSGFRAVGHFVFPKPYASNSRYLEYRHECAYLLAKGNPEKPTRPLSDVLSWGKASGNHYHPTQKPLDLMEQLVGAFTVPDDVVLDPFAGSGTTALAAATLGARYIAIEKDRQYYIKACNRLRIKPAPDSPAIEPRRTPPPATPRVVGVPFFPRFILPTNPTLI